jgi:acyl-CoA dehydrogenase
MIDLTKPQGTVELDQCWVNKTNFIQGFDQDLRKPLSKELISYFMCINGEMLGGANEVLQRTVHYVSERKQFGVPVGSFQAVKHKMADMSIKVELARSFNYYVAYMYEDSPEDQLINVFASRADTSEMYKNICEQAIQLHGGMGFTWEEGIHFWYKASLNNLNHVTHPTTLKQYMVKQIL